MGNRIPRRVALLPCFLSRTHLRPLWLPLTAICVLMFSTAKLPARNLELIRGVEAQPLKAQVERVIQALKYLGSPVNDEQTSNAQRRFGAGGLDDPGTAGSVGSGGGTHQSGESGKSSGGPGQ